MTTVSLNDGLKVPIIAYGTGTTWIKKDIPKPNMILVETIKKAIQAGYRHIDTSDLYETEKEVGMAIRESGVDRAEIIVASKNHNNLSNIPGELDRALQELGLEYLDIYLIHIPFFAKTPEELQSAWRQFEDLKATGKVRSIGVSNFTKGHLATILETAKVVPAINQVEMHPYLQQRSLVAFAKEHGITTAAFSPLTTLTKVKGGPIDAVIARLAQKYKVSEAAVLLKWNMQRGLIVVSTSNREERYRDYLENTEGWELQKEEMDEINQIGDKWDFRWVFAPLFKTLPENWKP